MVMAFALHDHIILLSQARAKNNFLPHYSRKFTLLQYLIYYPENCDFWLDVFYAAIKAALTLTRQANGRAELLWT